MYIYICIYSCIICKYRMYTKFIIGFSMPLKTLNFQHFVMPSSESIHVCKMLYISTIFRS